MDAEFKYKFQTVLLTVVTFIAISCTSDETPTTETATLTTELVSDITLNSALSGGLITYDGGVEIALRGVCWNTNPNPTTADFSTKDGSGIGLYESQMSELERATKYYVRAYAINNEGTSYGQEITFSTATELPILSTNEISDITLNSAFSGGLITDDGGADITVRGVCWSTSPLPTVDDNKTNDGSGIGFYESQIVGLDNCTRYYVRAYAINIQGVSYGQEISLNTVGTFVDARDNVTYKCVGIGKQVWMAENLAYLPQVDDNSTFANATDARYGIYGYDGADVDVAMATTNYSTYGVLYNWYAAMADASSSDASPSGVQGVCPSGWHLPSDAEWTTLEDALIGENTGSQLAGNAELWTDGNIKEVAEFGTSGFTALPGGNRYYRSGTFNFISESGGWWSSTQGSSSSTAIIRDLYYTKNTTKSFNSSKSHGFYVRCLRD